MITVKVNGNTYRSIAAAWRAISPEGLSQIAVRKRLQDGWYVETAFLTGVVKPVDRRGYRHVRRCFGIK